ncbi:hypothetical protein FGG08_005427 [Glutinoglossum americanum]|uniref:Conserved oligomeric Golgi complex subunit 4 n=1 Tax=Glutinoglossum americanum TaxID=1670608 RepID=A0A9P8HY78_9PEZI|nr:hypothetical protein FGG08_005427 [Glutinoglossum americanum]
MSPPSQINGQSSESPNILEANSIAEIQATLAHLGDQEAIVTNRLNSLIASQKDLSRELGRLDFLRAHLGSQVATTRSVSNGMLSDAASTAKRTSSTVKRLDLEQSRVKATLEVVEQVVELKACVLGVTGSMGAPQDWETAAVYLSRASKIPKDIINGQFAEETVPTAEVPDPPSVTLEAAAESLCGLFIREFEKAAKEGDGTKVTRFFKLFPLIGKSDVGLDIYGRYVCQGVTSRARANLHAGTGGSQRKDSFFYANALTKLFEHIAQIVEGHGGLVERHYGIGKMVKVIERLQKEVDVQGGIILDTWADERHIDRKLTDIKSYAFSFLVQSFLSAQRVTTGVPRSNSPAHKDGVGGGHASEDEGVDMKEVDGFLSEAGIMLARWSLYSRFLASKCRVRDNHLSLASKKSAKMRQDHHHQEESNNMTLSLPSVILNSNLSRKVADRLINPFNTMTTFFFRRSVEKAFQLDEPPADLSFSSNPPQPNPPYITSAVDDVMYIVNKVLQRSLATSQCAVVSNVIPTVGRVLGSDFVGMIQRKMRDESYPKSAVQGAPPPEDKVVAFLVLINNLDVATDYTKRIVQSRLEPASFSGPANGEEGPSTPLEELFPFGNDAAFAANALKSMESSFAGKTSELIGDGIQVTFNQIVKPRLRPILSDAFRDIDYLLKEEDLAERNHNGDDDGDGDGAIDEDAVKRRFEQGWDSLIKPLNRLLTERNFDKLLSMTASYLSRVLEKRIWSYYGRANELGAVRLERDIAGVVGTVVRGGRYGIREVFMKCTQICLVMNMEEDEWDELKAAGDESEGEMHWKLSLDERNRARAMIRDGR